MSDAKVIPGSPPEGVSEGAMFASRNELADAGVHGVRMQGIWTSEGRVIGIVLNGGYEDDEDRGNVVVYTGDGGRDPNSGKQIDDQGFTAGNRGLIVACALKTPIRVTRGWKCKSDLAPKSGFRYDGLYDVAAYQYVQGNEGFFVWQFTLKKHGTSFKNITDEPQGIDHPGEVLAALLSEEPPRGLDFHQSASVGKKVDFKALQFTGSGNEVIRIDLPDGLHAASGKGAAVMLRWRQYGDWDSVNDEAAFIPTFRLNFILADGTISPTNLFELYGYEGSEVLVFERVPVAMEVVSDAKWSVQLDSPLNSSLISTDQTGSCSTVLRFGDYTSGAKIIRVVSEEKTVDGVSYSGQFSAKAWGRYWSGSDETSPIELMSSNYGDSQLFSGSRVIPKGTILVEVRAPNRQWSLYLEDL